MAKQETTTDLPLPTEGGSYIRDDQTGTLTRADAQIQQTTEPAAKAVAPEKE